MTTPLIGPTFHGPKVFVLTGFHLNQSLPNARRIVSTVEGPDNLKYEY